MTLPALFLFLSPPVDVRPLPDAPIAKVQTVHAPVDRFMDRPARIALGVNVALLGADMAQTCHNLANGGRERYLPTQSCAGTTAILAGEAGALWLGAKFAHKRGWHKLERILEFTMPVVDTKAMIYSHEHGAL